MAKKAKNIDAPVIEQEAPVVKETIKKSTKPQWEIKDRN
jgi:hypothetical protein